MNAVTEPETNELTVIETIAYAKAIIRTAIQREDWRALQQCSRHLRGALVKIIHGRFPGADDPLFAYMARETLFELDAVMTREGIPW